MGSKMEKRELKASPPQGVFSYGNIWHIDSFDTFIGTYPVTGLIRQVIKCTLPLQLEFRVGE